MNARNLFVFSSDGVFGNHSTTYIYKRDERFTDWLRSVAIWHVFRTFLAYFEYACYKIN